MKKNTFLIVFTLGYSSENERNNFNGIGAPIYLVLVAFITSVSVHDLSRRMLTNQSTYAFNATSRMIQSPMAFDCVVLSDHY